jgi:hypothetical protein
MTIADLTTTTTTTTSQGGAQHTRLRPDWYLRVGLENDAPLVERRGFWRGLVRLIFGGANEHPRARRLRSRGAGV